MSGSIPVAEARVATPALPSFAQGIERIRCTSRSGLSVNVWVLPSEDGPWLVDSGFPTTVDGLRLALADLRIVPQDVAGVLFTHTHEDHMGGAVALEQELGGRRVVWAGTPSVLLDDWYGYYEALPRWIDWLEGLLPDGPVREQVLALRRRRPHVPLRTSGSGRIHGTQRVAFGEELQVGTRTLRCLDARGHDPAHCAWLDPGSGILLSGDVLLGLPTPILPPYHDSSATYRQTLLRWQSLDGVRLVLPGHGRPLDDFPAEVARSLSFCELVWDTLAAALRAGPTDPGVLAFSLPGATDPRRAMGWLSNLHGQLIEFAAEGWAVCDPATRLWRLQGAIPPFTKAPAAH